MTPLAAFLRGRSATRRGGPRKFLSFCSLFALTSPEMERIITFHENSKKRQEGLRSEGERPETPPRAGNAPGGVAEHVDARRVRALAADRQGGRQEPNAVRPGQARGRGHGVNRAVEAGAAGAEGARGAERSGRPRGAGAKGGGGRASRAKSSRASKSASTRAGAQASRRRKCRTSRRR